MSCDEERSNNLPGLTGPWRYPRERGRNLAADRACEQDIILPQINYPPPNNCGLTRRLIMMPRRLMIVLLARWTTQQLFNSPRLIILLARISVKYTCCFNLQIYKRSTQLMEQSDQHQIGMHTHVIICLSICLIRVSSFLF